MAGGGPLPARVARAAAATGRRVFVLGFEGHVEPASLAGFDHVVARPGAGGRILAALRAHGCTELVLIGPVRRPGLRELRPDAEGARLLARIGRAFFAGDDGLLAAIVRILGEEGFAVRGAHEFLRHDLAEAAGALGRHRPDAPALDDIARAVRVLSLLGAADVGQACVVQQGAVLAVEAIEGTDRMLGRVAALALPGPGGVLVKLSKPGQERRADLPTIGPETVAAAHRAGLRGIALEAGLTLMVERDALVGLADRLGLFVWAVGTDGGEPSAASGAPVVTSEPGATDR